MSAEANMRPDFDGPAAASFELLQAPCEQAQQVMAMLLATPGLRVEGVTQEDMDSFTEEVIFPLIAAAAHQDNAGREFPLPDTDVRRRLPQKNMEIRLFMKGRSHAQIADRLRCAESTVRNGITATLLSVSGHPGSSDYIRTQITSRYPEASLIDPPEPEVEVVSPPEPVVRRARRRKPQPAEVGSEVDIVNADGSFVVNDAEEDDKAPTVQTAGASADPVKDYLKLIGKIPLIDAEQEVEKSKRIEAGLVAGRILGVYALGDPPTEKDAAESTKEKRQRNKAIDDELAMRWPDQQLSEKLIEELQWLVEDGKLAKDEMIEANLRLVVSLAKRYTGRGMLFTDLISEGNTGLIRAVEKFDYTKGYKFSTYATWWIRQAITRAMADQARTIRIPVHMVEVINKVARVEREMIQDLGREPTTEELAKEVDLTPERVLEVKKYGREPISLQTPIGEDGDSEFGDLLEDTSQPEAYTTVVSQEMVEKLHAILDTLTEREAGVISMRFGLTDGIPKTLDDIGKVYGVTRERIRQIENTTMSKLRHPIRSNALRPYLDDPNIELPGSKAKSRKK